MAAYRPKKIELTTQPASDLQANSKVSESLVTQQRPATQNDAKQTSQNPDCGDGSGEPSEELEKNPPTIERNPAILGALDSIHRSLLFNNLKFDTDKTQHASNAERSPQDSDRVDATVKQSNHDDVQAPTLETGNTRIHQTVQHAEKVNIVHAKIDTRPTNEPEKVCHRPGSALTFEHQKMQRSSGQDWNNNANGNGAGSRVKMMVKTLEADRRMGTSAHDAHCGAVKDEGRVRFDAAGCEVETSDFDSASLTSGSSAADTGSRSQRTSSAFSEGSRDVASIDRFDMAMVQTSGASDGAATQVDAARHATTITININCRCDTNPQRMSKAAVEAKSKANVDTARCAGETSEPTNLGRTEFGSKPCSSHTPHHRADDGKLASIKHYIPQADGSDETESEELMELEQQENEGSEATGDYQLEDELEQRDEASHDDDVGHGAKKGQHKAHRGSLDNNRYCRSPEDDEYHDCDELHESTLSFYEEATSQPATPSVGKSRSPDDGDKPMISIVQELSEDRGEVLSTITLNKAQIREMQKFNNTKKIEGRRSEPQMKKKPSEEQPEKRRKSHGSDSGKKRHDKVNFNRQQRIMDDNFCNEILDSTIHFDRLYGIKRPQQEKGPVAERSLSPAESVASPAREECFSDSALCGVASPGEESFDSSMSLGKLESKPRYSGKTVGRLMVARLKKLQQATLKPIRAGTSHPPAVDSSDASTNSSMLLLHSSGPKKPPRTFANSPKRSVVRCGKHEASAVEPSCPTREELDANDPSNRGKDSRPKSHHIGWRMAPESGKNQSIPAQVYDMLHYSEDETRKRLIRTGNSRAAPQQSSAGGPKRRQEELHGHKLDIDTVDGRNPEPRTPDRRHSSSTDFDRFVRESNVKSTPHRREGRAERGKPVSASTRRILEEFLNDERSAANHGQLPINVGERRRRTTGGLFERRRQQQENFLDDARCTNHEPRRKPRKGTRPPATALDSVDCPAMQRAASRSSIASVPKAVTANGKIVKRKTFRKAALLKHTRSLFEASKKKIWSVKKCETPKKVNSGAGDPDPNINRNSSVKKKQNLHHKHLGYTPDNLRCKSCCRATDLGTQEERREAVVSLKRVSDQHSVPRGKGNKENRSPPDAVDGEERTGQGQPNQRKSVRSLNFATQRQQSERQRPVPSGESRDEPPSPSKTSKQLSEPTKFMKSLRSLKISPRKYFRFGSQTQDSNDLQGPSSNREATGHALGEFHSFDDLNLDSVAHMGDFLNQIRQIVERQGGPNEHVRQGNQVARRSVDAHDCAGEPIYQEITQKGHKTILNEFISSESNKRYLMVNNDPNILYATVNKPGPKSGPGLTTRARSLTDVASTGVVDPVVTSTPVSKPLNNTSKSQGKPTNRRVVTLSPMGVDHYADDEDDSYLYSTALTGAGSGCAEGRRSLTTTSTTRRSLFSPESSFCSSSDDSDTEGRHASDDNDISVLQDKEQQQQQQAAALEQESLIMQERAEDRQAPRRENERIQRKPNDDGDEGVDECGTGLESWRSAYKQQQAVSFVPAQESLIVRERAEDRHAVRRVNERIGHKPNDDQGVDECGTGLESWRRGFVGQAASRDCFAFEKDIILELEPVAVTHRSIVDGGDVVPGSSKELGAWKHKTNVAPISGFDSDGEIESLDRYQDKEVVELVNSLHNNVTLSDIGTLETGSSVAPDSEGYDTVDFVLPGCRRQFVPHVESRSSLGEMSKNDPRDVTVDTVDASKLVSHPSNDSMRCTSTVSPLTGSPSSGKTSSSSSTGGGAVMRNLKQKLRSSFRKSKSFIKTERQRIANYIREERNGSSKNSASSSSSASSSPSRQQQRRPEEETDETYHSLADSARTSVVAAGSMMELSNQFLGELITQIKQQGDARKQLKQALAICRTTHEFECSTELIEAERLLLLATLKETAARNELSKIDYATNGMTVADRKRVGKVALNHFEFPLKDTAIGDTLFNYFYIVVCTYKHEVRATPAQERRPDGRVYFRDCEIVFRDLDADYEVRVEVFVLRLRKNVKNISFENRYHLDKDSKRTTSCPSPSKFRRAGKMLSFRASSPKNFDFDNEFSRFKSQGFLTLTSFTLVSSNVGVGDERASSPLGRTIDGTYLTAATNDSSTATAALLDDDSPSSPYYSVSSNFQKMIRRQGNQNVFLVEDFKYLALDSMAYTSNMSGTIGMSVSSEVRFEGSDVHGFLDVGEKVDDRINWNRRWCKINGFTLEFWNYPQESNEKPPIQCVDLVRCVNERIDLADRSICSRARTMKVDIFAAHSAPGVATSCNSSGIGSYRSTGGTNPSTGTGVASSIDQGRSNVTCYLLAVDSHTELRRWMNELNRVAKFLKEWKI